jgi:CRISPR-associated protein Cas2
MAWVVVMFDLPVGTSEERRAATHFRNDLITDGYFMMQFSVYARPCGSADKVETHMRRLKSKIPPSGEVRSLIITDAQTREHAGAVNVFLKQTHPQHCC